MNDSTVAPRVLLATDGSEAARLATQGAARIAAGQDAEPILLHVTAATDHRVARMAPAMPLTRHVDDPLSNPVLAGARPLAVQEGATSIAVLLSGDPTDGILAWARHTAGADRPGQPTPSRDGTRPWPHRPARAGPRRMSGPRRDHSAARQPRAGAGAPAAARRRALRPPVAARSAADAVQLAAVAAAEPRPSPPAPAHENCQTTGGVRSRPGTPAARTATPSIGPHDPETPMTYVIAEPCIGTKDNSCVELCPVDCIHPTPDEPDYDAVEQLFIDPEECIDCDACVEACPVDAIFAEDQLPEEWQRFRQANADYYSQSKETLARSAAAAARRRVRSARRASHRREDDSQGHGPSAPAVLRAAAPRTDRQGLIRAVWTRRIAHPRSSHRPGDGARARPACA